MRFASNLSRLFPLVCLAAVIALALGLFGPYGQVNIGHAMDCEIDCYGGLPPPPEPDDNEEPDDDNDKDDGDPGGPTSTLCPPTWTPPTISTSLSLTPAHPITIGQDPEHLGVDVSGLMATGGASRCPNQPSANIVRFSITQVRLAASSVAWINGDLARKYPGARVKGSYPFTPQFQAVGLGSPVARIAFHLDPLDPGYYEVHLQAVQSDGQQVTAILNVPVHLMESTIIQ
jgi:hypothetical protein